MRRARLRSFADHRVAGIERQRLAQQRDRAVDLRRRSARQGPGRAAGRPGAGLAGAGAGLGGGAGGRCRRRRGRGGARPRLAAAAAAARAAAGNQDRLAGDDRGRAPRYCCSGRARRTASDCRARAGRRSTASRPPAACSCNSRGRAASRGSVSICRSSWRATSSPGWRRSTAISFAARGRGIAAVEHARSRRGPARARASSRPPRAPRAEGGAIRGALRACRSRQGRARAGAPQAQPDGALRSGRSLLMPTSSSPLAVRRRTGPAKRSAPYWIESDFNELI